MRTAKGNRVLHSLYALIDGKWGLILCTHWERIALGYQQNLEYRRGIPAMIEREHEDEAA